MVGGGDGGDDGGGGVCGVDDGGGGFCGNLSCSYLRRHFLLVWHAVVLRHRKI